MFRFWVWSLRPLPTQAELHNGQDFLYKQFVFPEQYLTEGTSPWSLLQQDNDLFIHWNEHPE